ncbi:MAG TPA: hypothetical protein VK338_03885 [Candidatus Nitrosocosmicus sp.]|nr:hypothetical protein [Candidatus Nitrosocosmicus sp.]
MLHHPYYDPLKSYDENFENGPFGAFADSNVYEEKDTPRYDFLGYKVNLPFGIPAGPVINSKFVKSAFEKGFDLVVYKTVRSDVFPCHQYPNVLPVQIEGDLTFEKVKDPLTIKTEFSEPLSITNSFGVPSKAVSFWQDDVKKAISYEREGQVLIASFMGTVKPEQTQNEFIQDYALAAKFSKETGAKILETNLSCPNIGNEGLVCYNLDVTKKILEAIRKEIGDTPLIIKIGYFADLNSLEELATIANEYADAISAINTIQATIVDEKGTQALPGNNRLKSGVCGAGIKWAGIDMVQKLKLIKEKKNHSYKIIGVGGVMKLEHYFEYIEAGADAVMSATGSMWNPYLAQEIKNLSKK